MFRAKTALQSAALISIVGVLTLFQSAPTRDHVHAQSLTVMLLPPDQNSADQIDSESPSGGFMERAVAEPTGDLAEHFKADRWPQKRLWSGAVTPVTRIERGSYTSVQVNINALGQNIQGDAANEPSIAVSPVNPQIIVVGWRQFNTVSSSFRQAGWAYSHDGGQTWTFPGVVEPNTFSSDPVLGSDHLGNFYYFALQPDRGPGDWACYLYKSFNGGVTWPQERYARGGDKGWMAIDKTIGVGRGNIYLAWSNNAGCCGSSVFTRSIDGGLTFAFPLAPPKFLFSGTMAVSLDGTLYVAAGASSEGATVLRSRNARNRLETPVFDLTAHVDLGGLTEFGGGPNPGGLLGQMNVAAHHTDGPDRGHVFLLGSVNPPGMDPLDVMFSRSTDSGVTWSPPVRVNDDPIETIAWQWFGTMGVAPNGRIDVVWNDTRNDPGQTPTHSELYYSYSFDGGRTWSPNEAVTPPFPHFVGYPQQPKLGDYYDIVSDNAGANVIYAATFNNEQDVYFVRITRRCSHPSQCNDGNSCTLDLCLSGSCLNNPIPGVACFDDDICTTNHICSGSGVCASDLETCDDGNPCTTDMCCTITTCVEEPGCYNFVSTETCDDGDDCTFDDQCDLNGACVGTPVAGRLFGDLDENGAVDVVDLACTLDAYRNAALCPAGDVFPCGGGDGLMTVDDILAVLDAVHGEYACPHFCM